VFRATSQIDYNNAVIAKQVTTIQQCEEELQKLKEITTSGGSEALGVENGWMGLRRVSAIKERARWLLDKMGAGVEKMNTLEKENAEMVKVLGSGFK
jgi:hypothetical protein